MKIYIRYWKTVMFIAIAVIQGYSTYANVRWKRVIDLERKWKFTIGDNKKWADPKYNDADWEEIKVPAWWENEGFGGYDGYAWYRITFNGQDLDKNIRNYNLFLGYIDDVDEVFINGHLIGGTGTFPPNFSTAYNALRNYYIPVEYLNFNGPNTIAVRVFDTVNAGGIVGGDVGIFTDLDDIGLPVNLKGVWDFAMVEENFGFRPHINYDNDVFRQPDPKLQWKKVSVPKQWEYQGYHDFDGTAWYRKQFEIPKSMEGEDLVLLLGKIDDYDQTYFNGKLIGSTNQYDKLRIYTIPEALVNAGGFNIILVFVHDREQLGGIYEGPVGIIKQSQLTKYLRYRN